MIAAAGRRAPRPSDGKLGVVIPLVDVKAQYAPLIPELKERFAAVLESGRFILGPEVEAVERSRRPTSASRRRSASRTARTRCSSRSRHSASAPATRSSAPRSRSTPRPRRLPGRGAPVFADIDPDTLNLDPRRSRRRITPRTKAIMAVHLFGRPAALGRARKPRHAVARGRRPGDRRPLGERRALGDVATFCFFPTKNLAALGDGGLVACRRRGGRRARRKLRFHGSRDKQTSSSWAQLAPRRAAGGRAARLLPLLDGWNDGRLEAAGGTPRWASARSSTLPRGRPGHVYHLYACARPTATRIAGAAGRSAASGPAATTRCRSTCSRCSPTWATGRARSRRPSVPPARTSACRSSPRFDEERQQARGGRRARRPAVAA